MVNPLGLPQWYTPEVMGQWNEALYDLQRAYPNMWLYAWDKDIQIDWFIPGDGVHYNRLGSSERSYRFAQAVINAWPMTFKGDEDPLLSQTPKPVDERVISGERPKRY